MKKNNVYSDLLVSAVVQNVNTYDDPELLEAENDLASQTEVSKSESVLALLNSDKEITEKDLILKPNKDHHRMSILMKVAVIFLVFCSVSIVTVSVAKGFNVDFLKLFINKEKGEAIIDNGSNAPEGPAFFIFNYIPEGFSYTEQITMPNLIKDCYETENKETRLTITQSIGYDTSVDNDNGYEMIFIKDIPCYYFENDFNYILLFEKDDITVIITVTGDLNFSNNAQNELTKIVESMEK